MEANGGFAVRFSKSTAGKQVHGKTFYAKRTRTVQALHHRPRLVGGPHPTEFKNLWLRLFCPDKPMRKFYLL